MQNSSPFPIQRPGPEIHSTPTVLTICTAPQLRDEFSSLLPGLRTTVNAAFHAGMLARPDLRRHAEPRLPAPDTLLTQLRDDPGTFIAVLHRPGSRTDLTGEEKRGEEPEGEVERAEGTGRAEEVASAAGPEILATATARRYRGLVPGQDYPFMRREGVREGYEEWELKLLAVHPDCQRRGLAEFLMGVVEGEVVKGFAGRRREEVEEQRREKGEGEGEAIVGTVAVPVTKVRMVLSAVKEMQERYYAQRGYVWESERPRGEPYNFHIVHMVKELDVGGVGGE